MAGSDLPDHLTLNVGEEYVVELPSLATAGYMWREDLSQSGVIEVSWTLGVPAGSAPLPVGQSAPERLKIRALAPGELTLTLNQRRSWERNRPAVRSHSIHVSVS
jgi:predicted secreted protein